MKMPGRFGLLCAVLLLAGDVRAEEPGAETSGALQGNDGTISLLAGWRYIPQGHFLNDQRQNQGRDFAQKVLQPGAILSFGYQVDEQFHVSIDLGYGLDRYESAGGAVAVKTALLGLAADTALVRAHGFTFYGGGGLGYALNTFTLDGASSTESNSTMGFIKLGIRQALGERLALVVEDRYTVASAEFPAVAGHLNTGGNLLSVGLLFHFRETDDHTHGH